MRSNIPIDDFDYPLPDERIARHPLPQRDASRLLFDDGNQLRNMNFRDLPGLLPANTLLMFNDTRVFHARLLFRKESGALIEVFCLEPVGIDFQQSFSSLQAVEWQCLVGNAKRWKSGSLFMDVQTAAGIVRLEASLRSLDKGLARVLFRWEPASLSFGELVEAAGAIPIPPYLKRDAEADDKLRYQTVYARTRGSVAAPTAGLHFTPAVMEELRARAIPFDYVTLHVGAGTFKPVLSESIDEHEMHPEHFIVSRSSLEAMIASLTDKKVIAVGTTTVRTLESLYWLGVDSRELLAKEVSQWRPYESGSTLSPIEALTQLLQAMQSLNLSHLEGVTRIMIRPGYRFRIVGGLVTNFHQPRSTLLLLVAALMGERWKKAYQFALDNGFRFLSYGDSCLFLPRLAE